MFLPQSSIKYTVQEALSILYCVQPLSLIEGRGGPKAQKKTKPERLFSSQPFNQPAQQTFPIDSNVNCEQSLIKNVFLCKVTARESTKHASRVPVAYQGLYDPTTRWQREKTTTLHVHLTFLYISLPFQHDYDMKIA